MSRLKSLLQSLALIALGCTIAFALAEVIVRVFLPEPILPRFVVDTGFGVRGNQPNIVTRHFYPKDYDVTVSTNSVGMRGTREYSIKKPDNTYRIAVIGDSFIFGHGVEDNEVVSAVLEDLLNSNAKDDKKYEVINFSVSGFGQAEELVTYEKIIKPYKPDHVVLFYFSNDVGNNAVSQLYKLNDKGEAERTGNSYLPGVKLREKLYGFAPTRWLFTSSQFWNFIRNRLSSIVQKSLLKKQGLKSFDSKQPVALDLSRALLTKFIKDIKSNNSDASIFVIPLRNKKLDTLQTNFPLSNDEVTGLGAKIINDMKSVETTDYFQHDGHWRASGHLKSAHIIIDKLVLKEENRLSK